jgi:hypothetical protein
LHIFSLLWGYHVWLANVCCMRSPFCRSRYIWRFLEFLRNITRSFSVAHEILRPSLNRVCFRQLTSIIFSLYKVCWSYKLDLQTKKKKGHKQWRW